MPSESLAPAESLFPEESPSRSRGRPKGSKNRPKPTPDESAASALPTSASDASASPENAAAPRQARAAKASKPAKEPKEPKAPKAPKEAKAPKPTQAPKAPKSPKAPETLTKALSKLLAELTRDLRLALDANPDATRAFQAEHRTAREAERTAEPYLDWLASQLDQIAASWILSSVFVRFVEDNQLIDAPRLSGPLEPGPSGLSPFAAAKAAEEAHYDQHPGHGEGEYLAAVFADLARLPGLADLFDQQHAALWRLQPRPEGARALLAFFRQQDPETGHLRWSFVDPELSTRFLGDLYQELSEFAQKRYALLQTPEFVERFLLDQTLEPALQDFGLEALRLIDPTCGSGHFLLGAFERLCARWQAAAPGEEARTLVARALAAVHGVDVNPFAIAIARFRLLVAANRQANVQRLAAAPNFKLNLAVGDSLLHGERFSELRGRQKDFTSEDKLAHVYPLELPEALARILGQQYHVVVGNPPYITVKDPALNEAYRAKYGACSGKYSLSVPFLERFVELALEARPGQPAGYSGQITSNSFMKREFGQKVIEEYFPNWDLTHVIDTSGAYIPGHGTPTVILLIRHRRPVQPSVRAVLGIRGEPSTPADPARGLVWSEILGALHRGDFAGTYVSSADVDRATFHKHPWSLGGGGAAELKELIEKRATSRLGECVSGIGRTTHTGEDDVYFLPARSLSRIADGAISVPLVKGDDVRDWNLTHDTECWFPYDPITGDARNLADLEFVYLWRYRSILKERRDFGQRPEERGLGWFAHSMFFEQRFRTPLSIAYAEIATHNHFVLDRGGKVFNRTAPVIKLPPDATEDDHLALLALLNSSVASFWMKQVFYPKASTSGDISVEKGRPESNRFAFAATGMLKFPLHFGESGDRERLVTLARGLDQAAIARGRLEPSHIVKGSQRSNATALAAALDAAAQERERLQERMRLLQEDLDWLVYTVYGLADRDVIATVPGSASPAAAEARQKLRANDRTIAQLEDPMFKRLWLGRQGVYGSARTGWTEMTEDAIKEWIFDRVEASLQDGGGHRSVAVLLEELSRSAEFSAMLELLQSYVGIVDTGAFVRQALEDQSVPFVTVQRLSETGLLKHAAWRETWRLQRLEDPFLEQQERLLAEHFGSAPAEQRRAREHVACWKTSDKLSKEKGLDVAEVTRLEGLKARWLAIEAQRQRAIGGETPPVPPKYEPKDFRSPALWRQRGKLDVPKERFISYPHCSPDGDPSLLLGWAGWNHLKRAEALVQILEARKREGWTGGRLAPILLGLFELQFWLDKWHPDVAEEYQAFLEQETNQAGLTPAQVRAWTPPAKGRKSAPATGRQSAPARGRAAGWAEQGREPEEGEPQPMEQGGREP